MENPFKYANKLIDDAVISAKSNDYESVKGSDSLEFMRGYIRALDDKYGSL